MHPHFGQTRSPVPISSVSTVSRSASMPVQSHLRLPHLIGAVFQSGRLKGSPLDIYCLAAARRASASVGKRPVVSGQDVNGAPQIIE